MRMRQYSIGLYRQLQAEPDAVTHWHEVGSLRVASSRDQLRFLERQVGMARAIGETAPIITIGALTFIAFLPPSPVMTQPPFISFDWLTSPFTVMPIQMFNWTSRPEASFHHNAAAAGLVLLFMTLSMNAIAIYLRYQLRKRIKW